MINTKPEKLENFAGASRSKKTSECILDRPKKRVPDFLGFLESFKLSDSEVGRGVWVKAEPFRPAVTSKSWLPLIQGKESSEGDLPESFCHYLWLTDHFGGV